MASPYKLAHVALSTTDVPKMRDWYVNVLEAEVVHENDFACFLTYDDEHHRVVFVKMPGADESDAESSRLLHFAFTYDTLDKLLETYTRLRDQGIKPSTTLHHGPTLSMYYRDPQDNTIELQIDVMSMKQAREFCESEVFAKNPIGITYDPEDLVNRWRDGASYEELTRYPA
ncbi:MAG: VOC family protein [Deltaproteobacteria bacterium]|nr:VOC family protein [Deltaproteobacteria bacterium]MBW2413794.1 VOC family protein [Deltaproteobacteria bacterium]